MTELYTLSTAQELLKQKQTEREALIAEANTRTQQFQQLTEARNQSMVELQVAIIECDGAIKALQQLVESDNSKEKTDE